MTYWLVLFIQPKPVPDQGPIKLQLSRGQYERLTTEEGAGVDCGKGNFSIISKRIFSIEADNSAFIVADAIKNRQE